MVLLKVRQEHRSILMLPPAAVSQHLQETAFTLWSGLHEQVQDTIKVPNQTISFEYAVYCLQINKDGLTEPITDDTVKGDAGAGPKDVSAITPDKWFGIRCVMCNDVTKHDKMLLMSCRRS